ncbi:hypothetical protein CO614_10720 [Lysobacteraceae bacterium NML120232]|nr:hypothetical protein CO614_10720 [Xanthomonadaceae bacterium NML120232]
MSLRIVSLLMLSVVLAGCQMASPPADKETGVADTSEAADTEEAASALELPLKDVTERNAKYLIGITYPAAASQHRKLAQALFDYAEGARRDLEDAVKLAGDLVGSGGNTYDLSLNFIELMNSPAAVVVAVDGSLYTGGAHGMPLIARFTYLPQEDRMLTPQALIPEHSGWLAVSDYVRKQLATQVETRLEEDEVPLAERAEITRSASNMIEEGTMPQAENFAQFEPIPAADGKWLGLRFVFPPYQVGPYSDGTQSVDVPAAVLRPHLAPQYRAMFTGN